MTHPRWLARMTIATLGAAPAAASAAPWWYVGHDTDRAVFVDVGSIERTKGLVAFSSKVVVRKEGDPVAMTVNFMQADCRKRQIGWFGTQRFGYDGAVLDTSTRKHAEMAAAQDAESRVQLDFACSPDHAADDPSAFALTIDDAAFTEALLAEQGAASSPRALHDRMAADATVPVIRSTAPAPSTFGTVQTVAVGEPLVPPRDYAVGAQVPDPKNYDSIEVGRIYDVAYQGIRDGKIEFEVRGYSIDDLVHAGSGQTETAELDERKVFIRDLAITIKSALPDRITYVVEIDKRSAEERFCPPGGC